jgi:hypothetical protein
MSENDRPPIGRVRDASRSEAVRAEAERKSGRVSSNADESYERRPGVRRRFRAVRWIIRALVLIAVVLAVLFLYPKVKALLSPDIEIDVPDSFSSLLPDPTMGYSKFDFSEAILGESYAKSDFVVLEQDVTIATRVSQALANLALFEKSQVIRSYGTGVYTVDLSMLTADQISMDPESRQIIIFIPHAALTYIIVDVEKTEYEETKKALFAFGEIKLTNEQLGILEQSIQDAMREELESAEMMNKADGYALDQVHALFAPIVQAVASEYSVKVAFEP